MFPLVSILMPVYNASRWVSDAIMSAKRQTWPRTEIIIVDDGSDDDSLTVARHFESANVKLISETHRGQPAALNRALKEAQGDYIQYLDADDVLAPDKVEIQTRRLLSEPGNAISTCSWARFYDNDVLTADWSEHPDYRDYSIPIDWLIQSWTGRGTMPPAAWLLPREVVEKAGPWNEELSRNNDTEYFTRAVLNSSKIVFCRKAQAYYRSGHGGLSGQRDKVAFRSYYRACELCTRALLAFENTPRTRHACACLWQYFVYEVYPGAPDLVNLAEQQISALGGADLKLKGSFHFKLVMSLVGWKTAKKIQRLYYRVRYG